MTVPLNKQEIKCDKTPLSHFLVISLKTRQPNLHYLVQGRMQWNVTAREDAGHNCDGCAAENLCTVLYVLRHMLISPFITWTGHKHMWTAFIHINPAKLHWRVFLNNLGWSSTLWRSMIFRLWERNSIVSSLLHVSPLFHHSHISSVPLSPWDKLFKGFYPICVLRWSFWSCIKMHLKLRSFDSGL